MQAEDGLRLEALGLRCLGFCGRIGVSDLNPKP